MSRYADMIDITGPEVVEVQIRSDGKVVWINIDGICQLRACMIKELIVRDDRPRKWPHERSGEDQP